MKIEVKITIYQIPEDCNNLKQVIIQIANSKPNEEGQAAKLHVSIMHEIIFYYLCFPN